MNMRLRRFQLQDGFTLSETLVVLVILGIVIGALVQLFVSASRAEVDMTNRFRAQQEGRLALDSLRHEIHCASTVTPTTGFPVTAVVITFPAGSPCGSGSITWCAKQVGSAQRFALWRVPGTTGATCTTTGGIQKADYLWMTGFTGQVFSAYTAAAACTRSKLSVDLPVDVKPETSIGLYRLQDDIVLRNTRTGCP